MILKLVKLYIFFHLCLFHDCVQSLCRYGLGASSWSSRKIGAVKPFCIPPLPEHPTRAWTRLGQQQQLPGGGSKGLWRKEMMTTHPDLHTGKLSLRPLVRVTSSCEWRSLRDASEKSLSLGSRGSLHINPDRVTQTIPLHWGEQQETGKSQSCIW